MSIKVMTVILGVALAVACGLRVVHFLPDNECGSEEVLLADLSGARITAVCVSQGSARAILVSTENRHRPQDGPLLAFSLGFCGSDVISVEAPTGWRAEVHGSSRAFYIDWQVSEDPAPQPGIRPGQKMSGFVVRLRPGWRRTGFISARWESSSAGEAVTHDNCDPPR